nr:hypothetical protein [Aliamphritea spongicola]
MIDWNQSAEAVARQIRGLSPWPVAYTQLNGETLRIWQADISDKDSTAAAGTVISTDKKPFMLPAVKAA